MRSQRTALTLIELLLTIAILAILAALIIPGISGDIPERLSAVAQIVASDLDYARSLAVANNSKYLLTFDTIDDYYVLKHSGTNAVLNTLPTSPFRHQYDTAETQSTDLTKLPISPSVELVAVVRPLASQVAMDLEFTPLGGTATTYETQIWLTCGQGATQRFQSVAVNPITGLVEIGPVLGSLPAPVQALVSGVSTGKPKGKGKPKSG
jgi:prepilin-type N-terminal cleavage/methylation domain-containing protein